MNIIPLSFHIKRDQITGKKMYQTLKGDTLLKPLLPKAWQTTKTTDLTASQTSSYAIRADDDLLVIDCDDQTSTNMIDDALVYSEDNYIVISDKGFKHYYFTPTEYYRKSPLYKTSRLALKKIDLLHGRALIFSACEFNETKEVFNGTKLADSKLGYNLTEIPNNIVDILIAELKTTILDIDSDYKPLTSYLAPTIEQALALYGRSKDYRDIQNLMGLITTNQYKNMLKPDYHPDRVIDGEGTNYLQSISSNIARDPSISIELHTELITLIAHELWSQPMTKQEIASFLSNLTTQTYSLTGKRVFVYDQYATGKPLVSINNNAYMPIYRTLDDKYILAKPTGSAELVSGTSNFRKTMASKNYKVLVDSKEINIDTNIAFKKLSESMLTTNLINLVYKNSGEYEESGSTYYNLYVPTKYIGIIRGEFKESLRYIENSHKTIDSIIYNIIYDHQNAKELYHKFISFLSHKIKTLDYSPLVFQMMGKRGIGKSLFMQILEMLTEATTLVKMGASNAQFNADTNGKMFLNEDEGLISESLINNIKSLSGNKSTRIESKGIDAYMARNVGTYICTTNKPTPMAETVDDRRFITFSSFKADRLDIENVETKIALELEQFALLLRDTKLINPRLYVDANHWHDDIHKLNFEEKLDKTQHIPSLVANFMFEINFLTGREVHQKLELCFGYGYHYIVTRGNKVKIPLYNTTQPRRIEDDASLTHEITREALKAAELDKYVKRDTNCGIYDKAIQMLHIQLSRTQFDAYEIALNNIEEIKDVN